MQILIAKEREKWFRKSIPKRYVGSLYVIHIDYHTRIFLTTWTPDLDFSWRTLILNLKILINACHTPMLIKAEKKIDFFLCMHHCPPLFYI